VGWSGLNGTDVKVTVGPVVGVADGGGVKVGSGTLVGDEVRVGGTGVCVGGTGVEVGGTDVKVGAMITACVGIEVNVGAIATAAGVLVGSCTRAPPCPSDPVLVCVATGVSVGGASVGNGVSVGGITGDGSAVISSWVGTISGGVVTVGSGVLADAWASSACVGSRLPPTER
jgi:hypothetical protein